jgi:hypothetical protein
MLQLPETIIVSLTRLGMPLLRGAILVSGNVFVEQRYYYGGLLSLTTPEGKARFLRREIEETYRWNQREFPMDFRVPLSECDAAVEFAVLGKKDFANARDNAMSNPLLLQRYRDLWSAADNRDVPSTKRQIVTFDANVKECFVTIDIAS